MKVLKHNILYNFCFLVILFFFNLSALLFIKYITAKVNLLPLVYFNLFYHSIVERHL